MYKTCQQTSPNLNLSSAFTVEIHHTLHVTDDTPFSTLAEYWEHRDVDTYQNVCKQRSSEDIMMANWLYGGHGGGWTRIRPISYNMTLYYTYYILHISTVTRNVKVSQWSVTATQIFTFPPPSLPPSLLTLPFLVDIYIQFELINNFTARLLLSTNFD